jgi:hypothetical protein
MLSEERFEKLGDRRRCLNAASRRHGRSKTSAAVLWWASNDRPMVFIYYGEGVAQRSLARLLNRDTARRVAAGIAKLPRHCCARDDRISKG